MPITHLQVLELPPGLLLHPPARTAFSSARAAFLQCCSGGHLVCMSLHSAQVGGVHVSVKRKEDFDSATVYISRCGLQIIQLARFLARVPLGFYPPRPKQHTMRRAAFALGRLLPAYEAVCPQAAPAVAVRTWLVPMAGRGFADSIWPEADADRAGTADLCDVFGEGLRGLQMGTGSKRV
jgi:hypothetical protein